MTSALICSKIYINLYIYIYILFALFSLLCLVTITFLFVCTVYARARLLLLTRIALTVLVIVAVAVAVYCGLFVFVKGAAFSFCVILHTKQHLLLSLHFCEKKKKIFYRKNREKVNTVKADFSFCLYHSLTLQIFGSCSLPTHSLIQIFLHFFFFFVWFSLIRFMIQLYALQLQH